MHNVPSPRRATPTGGPARPGRKALLTLQSLRSTIPCPLGWSSTGEQVPAHLPVWPCACPPAHLPIHLPTSLPVPCKAPHAPLLRECSRGDAWENQVACSTPPRPGSVLLPWADPRSHSPPCPCLCVQGRVCGLCGNFDGNALNDFTTRSQSVVGDVLEFGNSWKFSPSCPDARAPKDPCTANPYRKSWAQKQCSIINSATFSACRSQVGWGGGSGWGPDVGGWLTPCLPVGPGSGQQWASEDRCTRRTRPPTRQGIASPVPSAFPDHTASSLEMGL